MWTILVSVVSIAFSLVAIYFARKDEYKAHKAAKKINDYMRKQIEKRDSESPMRAFCIEQAMKLDGEKTATKVMADADDLFDYITGKGHKIVYCKEIPKDYTPPWGKLVDIQKKEKPVSEPEHL